MAGLENFASRWKESQEPDAEMQNQAAAQNRTEDEQDEIDNEILVVLGDEKRELNTELKKIDNEDSIDQWLKKWDDIIDRSGKQYEKAA